MDKKGHLLILINICKYSYISININKYLLKEITHLSIFINDLTISINHFHLLISINHF